MTHRQRVLLCQALEERQLLAASLGWDGPGLGRANLTYHIANSPNSLSHQQTTAAIETALAAWSKVADINFTPTNQPGLNDSIDIAFGQMDGPGGTLARAYFPDDVNPARIAGDVQFDSAETWEVGNAMGGRAFDLVWVAVHEIGHALGLDHLHTSSNAVLAPSVSANQAFVGLSAPDVSAIQKLYAPRVQQISPTIPANVDNQSVNASRPLPTTNANGAPNSRDPGSTSDRHDKGNCFLDRSANPQGSTNERRFFYLPKKLLQGLTYTKVSVMRIVSQWSDLESIFRNSARNRG